MTGLEATVGSMSDLLTPAMFEPHVGSEFAVELGDGTVVQTLLDNVSDRRRGLTAIALSRSRSCSWDHARTRSVPLSGAASVRGREAVLAPPADAAAVRTDRHQDPNPVVVAALHTVVFTCWTSHFRTECRSRVRPQ